MLGSINKDGSSRGFIWLITYSIFIGVALWTHVCSWSSCHSCILIIQLMKLLFPPAGDTSEHFQPRSTNIISPLQSRWEMPTPTLHGSPEARIALPSLHNGLKVPRLSHSTSSRTLKVLSAQKSHSAFPFPQGQALPLWPCHSRLIGINDDPQSLRSGVIGIPVTTGLPHLSPFLFQGAKPCFWTVQIEAVRSPGTLPLVETCHSGGAICPTWMLSVPPGTLSKC